MTRTNVPAAIPLRYCDEYDPALAVAASGCTTELLMAGDDRLIADTLVRCPDCSGTASKGSRRARRPMASLMPLRSDDNPDANSSAWQKACSEAGRRFARNCPQAARGMGARHGSHT